MRQEDDRTSWIPVLFFPPRVKAKIGLRVLTLERMSTVYFEPEELVAQAEASQTGISPAEATQR